MPASYPSSIKSFSIKNNGEVIYASHINDLQAEVVALETALVTGPLSIANVTISTNTVTSTGMVIVLVAGESVSIRDVVFVASNLTAGTAGRVYKMDADALATSAQAFFVGFASTAASAAQNVSIQIDGVVSGFTGLTTGALYYASGTAGAITATKPLQPVPVGIAISSTQLHITRVKSITPVAAIYGYAMGGGTNSTIVAVTTADRIAFGTSVTSASTVSNLVAARYGAAGVSDCSLKGYVMGGGTGSGPTAFANTVSIEFSTSITAASTVSNLSQARTYVIGVSDGSVYGYAMGGFTTASVVTADRITFSTSVTAASTVTNLPLIRYGMTSVSDGSVYGYVMGGHSSTNTSSPNTYRITFVSSVIAASTASNLSQGRRYAAGISDGDLYGYALGGGTGSTPTAVTTADRITFSSGVTAASTVSNLSSIRYGPAGVSSGAIYGYSMGGQSASTISAVTDRITFSTSVTAASTVSNLSQGRRYAPGISDGAV